MALNQIQSNPTPTQQAEEVLDTAVDIWETFSTWLESLADTVFSIGSLWQAVAIIVAAALGFLLSRFPVGKLKKLAIARDEPDFLFRLYKSIARVIWPAITALLLWVTTTAFSVYDLPSSGLRVVFSLLNAWIIVRLITSNMKEGFWSTSLALLAWTIAALYILRLLDPVTTSLDSAAFEFGGSRLSLLQVITSIVVAIIALWAGRVAGDAAQTQLKTSQSLTPSMAGLLGQVAKISLMVIALVVALYSVGVNLTALTVFSGALGVGIGFGMQKVFANFISGIIILFEKSLKVGDFIELQSGVTGLVQEINVRSTLITTNDNIDILVPNEEFINSQVINWTLKEATRRQHIPFGVAYGTDKELVRSAILEAAEEVEWTFVSSGARKPQVWLVEFGDSSLNFELVVWVTEIAVVRPARVIADYNWAIHTALENHGIEIPFPQRDLNFRDSATVRVQMVDPADETTDTDE